LRTCSYAGYQALSAFMKLIPDYPKTHYTVLREYLKLDSKARFAANFEVEEDSSQLRVSQTTCVVSFLPVNSFG